MFLIHDAWYISVKSTDRLLLPVCSFSRCQSTSTSALLGDTKTTTNSAVEVWRLRWTGRCSDNYILWAVVL